MSVINTQTQETIKPISHPTTILIFPLTGLSESVKREITQNKNNFHLELHPKERTIEVLTHKRKPIMLCL